MSTLSVLPRAILLSKKFRWWSWAGPALRWVKICEKNDEWCMTIPNCDCAACACQCAVCRSLGSHAPELCATIPGA